MVLAVLATAAVVAACGARTESGADGKGVDAPGLLVFSGLPAGSYLHALRPSGTGLAEVELPETCSPWEFTRNGRVLRCYDLSEYGETYATERRGTKWERVPLPIEWTFPDWVTKGMEGFAIDAPHWSPAQDRIALIRSSGAPSADWEFWFSSAGNVVVAKSDGTKETVVARHGQVPAWSPDGNQLAFARCRRLEAGPNNETAADSAECSVWVVPSDGTEQPRKIADGVDSASVWSPDGNYIAFFRAKRPCLVEHVVCEQRIFIVSAKDGEPRPFGPQLIEPSELFWLPEGLPMQDAMIARTRDDPLELQRCADIWNRAHIQWADGAASVSLGKKGCRVTYTGYHQAWMPGSGFQCWQLDFTFRCPSHGEQMRFLDPDERVWNAWIASSWKLNLFDAPKGPRLPLPKAPPYAMVDGYVLPFDGDGHVRQGLTISETHTGTCTGEGWIDHPDSMDCGWKEGAYSIVDHYCFKAPGSLRIGDDVLCPNDTSATSFIRLTLSKLGEPLD